jgi:ERF superfamily
MQRTSESIATLAAALAKAQIELTNPEKSLVATIRADVQGGVGRQFRYASLASGLEIVRKILGQHEIATVQTTSIDQTGGIINLTTVLAHSSGEWIASDWPVCPVSETETPHRMGTALTYARRYALFTLVGIAGEDDLDAPDLATPTNRTSGLEKSRTNGSGQTSGGERRSQLQASQHRSGKAAPQANRPALAAGASAESRDRLVAEIHNLGSGDEAAKWAHRCLSEKNQLTALDAQRVEETFQARLETLTTNASEKAAEAAPQLTSDNQDAKKSNKPGKGRHSKATIDKSALALPEPRRVRDRDHLKFVAGHPCLICDRRPSDAHHLRFAQSRALGKKVSDEFTVPLCRGHHREVHRWGDEVAWWEGKKIDPTVIARALWLETHPLAAGRAGLLVDTPDTVANVEDTGAVHC